MKDFYVAIARSESKHSGLFVRLAEIYFPTDVVEDRVAFFIEKETEAIAAIPPRPALH